MSITRLRQLLLVVPLVAGGAWLGVAAVVPANNDGLRVERGEQAAPSAAPLLPRCDRPEHRQFDFWVGEWDVRPNGQAESTTTALGNVIGLEDGGCVVTEHWTTPQMSGRSVNIFDRTHGQWHQSWVDSTGGLHQYWGGADADGNLVFHGDTPVTAAGNARQRVRMTFFNLGPDRKAPVRVRQFSEVLGADGRWTTNYDLIYYRRPGR